MTTKQDICGLEYDWLAVDIEGLVGLFSTAGGGYAPKAFLADVQSVHAAIEAILSLPVSTEATCAEELAPALPNIWKLAAERGIFAFDSDLSGGPYRLVASPLCPVTVRLLPAFVAQVVMRVSIPAIRFRVAREIALDQSGL